MHVSPLDASVAASVTATEGEITLRLGCDDARGETGSFDVEMSLYTYSVSGTVHYGGAFGARKNRRLHGAFLKKKPKTSQYGGASGAQKKIRGLYGASSKKSKSYLSIKKLLVGGFPP